MSAPAGGASPAAVGVAGGQRLRRHTIYNLAGLGAPLLVAVWTIPQLLAALGDARFGVLTLIWAVVSYFGLFDLGLGRALTQQLAALCASGRTSAIGPLVGTALVLLAGLGVVAGVSLAAAAPWAAALLKGMPADSGLVGAALWMAAAMPAIILTSGLRGILEARQAFGIVNLIRLPMGLFTFVGPLLVVGYAGPRLDLIAAVLALGRVVGCAVHAVYARRVLPQPLDWRFERTQVRPLATAGGWLSVSNIVSPFMGYLDRFMIGALISASAVAWYATPHELVSKLWIIPGALTAVLFPTFAAQFALDRSGNPRLFGRAVDALYGLLLPITVALALFAHEGLAHWIDADFAGHSAPLLQVFALGTLINCLAHVPFTLIQGAGAARLTALAHAIELPLFVGALWWLTARWGAPGAALAWLLRITLDTALMFELCRRLLGWPLAAVYGRRRALQAGLAALAFGGVAIESPALRGAWLAATAVAAAACLWPARAPLSRLPAEPAR